MAFKRIALGMAIGYVLGAKAGEKRFEQISDWWKDLTGSAWARRATEAGRHWADGPGRRALAAVRERAGWGDEGDERSERAREHEPDQAEAESANAGAAEGGGGRAGGDESGGDHHESRPGARRTQHRARPGGNGRSRNGTGGDEPQGKISRFVAAALERGRVD